MTFLKKLFSPKEVKSALCVLEEAKITLNNPEFPIIESILKEVLRKHPKDIISIIKNGTPARQWGYAAIVNVTGDLLETGKYHIYRGTLNPLGPGSSLLQLYDSAVDELVNMGIINIINADIEKKALRKNLNNVG